MDNLKELLLKIRIEGAIKIQDIQDVSKTMDKMRNRFGQSIEYMKYCHEILDILWHNMETGFAEFDDQLLCSTCFYGLLLYSNEKGNYLKKVLEVLNYELELKEKGIEISNSMFNTISLAYGIFQSSILQDISEQSILAVILEKTFMLLTLMAYEYSQYTFITFKIITFFKKTAGTEFQNVIFNKDHNFKLLNVINHNWENPITGVRSLNKIIFHNLISVADENAHELINQKLNGFYWNKAKYLMLAEIVENCQSNINVLIDKFHLVEGLVYSLNKAGLVSAGADMYVAILNKLTTEHQWCIIILPTIINIVKGSSIKPIENFINYWCLNTLKKFPLLSRTIFDELENLDNLDYKLYSCLCVIQQSNRLGLLEKYFNGCNHYEELVLNSIDHNDVHVRMVSFDIVCGLHNKCLPDQKKYDTILDFLNNNVNSDCSKLRINMIKSLQNFLVQLHMKHVNIKNNNECDIDNLITFCKLLQVFIIESIDFDGNYQRKIATIQIMIAMLIAFKEIPRKKQEGTRKLQTSLMDFIKSKNQWILSEKQVILKLINLLKDPSDDIREHVKDILLYNYSEQLSKKEFMTYLTEEAMSCIKSRFFYQITCGNTIFKLILNVLMIEDCTEGRFMKVEDIFHFAYNEIKSEYNSNLDIVKAIVDGKQQHSYLNILHSIFEISLQNSYELNISIDIIHFLIELLKNISNQFAWEQETMVSSDFSKMNDMVQEIIASSEYKISHQFNETNISGLHQVVLNCLWLNVKASCDLASILIRYYKNDTYKDVCEQCLILICNVLETSRHKGAIEAGGTALGQAIQKLTSLPDRFTISQIPILLLKRKFKQLILETSSMASVTRRGAGLSIMIHRIVSSDMKKGKPLFHYFMQTLLETFNLPEDSNYEGELDKSNEKDLPQAIYIHFLTKIVTDSSLASDMMYYSDKLAKLAFDNLSSSCWQIRNAALQLYGSLIPKIIGQKKNSGASEEVMATVAVDEFRTHSPKLWLYIKTQLEMSTKSHSDLVQCHNNLVPILSILANLAPFYSFTNEVDGKKNLLLSLISLLGSPIYVIRRLASRSILNIYPFEVTFDVLMNSSCMTENSLHGSLMLLNEFNKQYNIRGKEEKGEILRHKYKIFMARKCSYVSRERFESTFPEFLNLTEEIFRETLAEMHVNSTAPGIFAWANFRIQLYLENASWDSIPQFVMLISDHHHNFDTYCEILCNRIGGEKNIYEEILLQLSCTLYTLGFKSKSTLIWRTLYEISLRTQKLNNLLDTSLLHQYFLNHGVSYRMRYMIVFAARVFQNNATEELLYLSNIIYNLCCPDTDVDMRLIAASANNELASKFGHLSDSAKINTIKAAIMFLQDEDEDVRNLSVHFHRIVNSDKATHPYICLRNVLNKAFLHKVFNNSHTGIKSICNDLMDVLKSLSIPIEDEYNPFVSGSKNIFLEPQVLRKLLFDLKAP